MLVPPSLKTGLKSVAVEASVWVTEYEPVAVGFTVLLISTGR